MLDIHNIGYKGNLVNSRHYLIIFDRKYCAIFYNIGKHLNVPCGYQFYFSNMTYRRYLTIFENIMSISNNIQINFSRTILF